jgi:hypothetical protein
MMALSKVRPHARCPNCQWRYVTRSAVAVGEAFDEVTLWDLTEGCIMCGWTQTTASVKVGT